MLNKKSQRFSRNSRNNRLGLQLEQLENRQLLSATGFESADISLAASSVAMTETVQTAPADIVSRPASRIVNGEATSGYGAVGVVNFGCTGTLISPTHVLTAAHCVEDGQGGSIGDREGVFTVNGQNYLTVKVTVHPDYDFARFHLGYDIAIMELDRPVEGIQPYDILREAPEVGQLMTIVGFGQGGTSDNPVFDFGNKRVGQTSIEGVSDVHISWNLDSDNEANTARGDSGGPAFVNVNGELLIAGVTSGGSGNAHEVGSFSFDTRVDNLAAWIDSVVGDTTPVEPPSDDHVNVPGEDATLIALDADGRADLSGELETTNDRDVFRLVMSEAGTATLSTEASGRLDTILTLSDANGSTIANNDDFGGSLNSRVQVDLEAGTYFVTVSSYNENSLGRYAVSVAVDGDDPVDPPADDHVDAPSELATLIALDSSGNGTASGTLEEGADTDVFKLSVEEAGTAVIAVNRTGGNLDPLMQVLDAQGQVVAQNDDFGGSLNSQVETSLDAGTYYISVGSYADRSNGDYGVTVQLTADPVDPPSDDHVNTPGDGATLITLDDSGEGSALGQMDVDGDVDVFQIALTEAGKATIDVKAVFSSFDPTLTITDANGNVVAQDDNGGERLDSRVEVDLQAGTYFISVGENGDTVAGLQYGVSVKFDASTDPVDPPSDDHVNEPGDAATLIALDASGRGLGTGTMEVDGDVDVFKIVLSEDGKATIDVKAVFSSFDPTLKITDAEGNVVVQDDNGGELLDSRVEVDLQAGTYFISVGENGDTVDGRQYGVEVQVDRVASTTDDHVDGPGTEATLITLNDSGSASLHGELEQAGDRDAFRLNITDTREVSIELNGVNGLDTVLHVYNENGEIVASNDDRGDGTYNSMVSLELEAGSYFVTVGSFGDRYAGGYDLAISSTVANSAALEAVWTDVEDWRHPNVLV